MDFRRVAVITGKRASGWSQSIAADLEHGLRLQGLATELVDLETLGVFCMSGAGRDERTSSSISITVSSFRGSGRWSR